MDRARRVELRRLGEANAYPAEFFEVLDALDTAFERGAEAMQKALAISFWEGKWRHLNGDGCDEVITHIRAFSLGKEAAEDWAKSMIRDSEEILGDPDHPLRVGLRNALAQTDREEKTVKTRWQTEAIQKIGGCGAIGGTSPNEQACILPIGHTGVHGWEGEGNETSEAIGRGDGKSRREPG